ncbi:MAG: D-2-hydroxyacid dehydrogenase [Candidatus Bathyarchaeota archaeon]
MKILVTFNLPEEYLNEIRLVSPKIQVEKGIEKNIVLDKVKDVEILYAGLFDRDILAEAHKLKWVHNRLAGSDKFLFPEMVKSDLLLTNSIGVHRTQCSEHAMSLILAWTRKLHQFMKYQLKAEWKRPPGVLVCDEIWGKTIGIIGVGNIGAEIAMKAKAFDAKTLGLSHTKKVKLPQIDEMLPPGKLSVLLQRSDFVILAVPLTSETKGMIGEEELRQMKKTAVLVNIARGGVIQEEKLIRALKERWIAGAALDVFEIEPLPPDSELWKMENIIITPHVAGTTPHYDQRATTLFKENLQRYLEDKPLTNLVDKEKGY